MSAAALPNLQQISIYQAEHGLARPVARMRLEPSELTERLSISFESDRDDLDDFEGAVLVSEAGSQIGLMRHRNQPVPGTDILINERLTDFKAALVEALSVLRLDPKDLVWVHPDIGLIHG